MMPGGGLTILYRYRWSILLAGLLGLLLGGTALLAIPPSYVAGATLFLPPPAEAPASVVTAGSPQGPETASASEKPRRPMAKPAHVSAAHPAWHASVLTSDALLRRVVERERLDQDPAFVPRHSLLRRLDDMVSGATGTRDATVEALQTLTQNITVTYTDDPSRVTVEVTNADPDQAARLRDALLEVYRTEIQAAAHQDASRPPEKSQDRNLSRIQAHITTLEALVKELQALNPVVLLPAPPRPVATTDQPKRASAPLSSEPITEPTPDASAPPDGPSAAPRDHISSRLLDNLHERMAIVAHDEAVLAAQLRNRHPDLTAIRAERAALQIQIDRETRRIAAHNARERAAREPDIERALQREEAAKRQAEQRLAEQRQLQKRRAETAPPPSTPLDMGELQRELATLRDLIATALSQAADLRLADSPLAAEVHMITSPVVPHDRETPDPLWVLPLGLLAGLGFGIGRARVHRAHAQSLKFQTHVSHFLGAPARARLPRLNGGRLIDRVCASVGGPLAGVGRPPGFDPVLGALQHPDDEPVSRYRQSLLRLLGTLVVTSPHKRAPIIVVASARSGSGASSVALALAYEAARAGERVLLVDATSRNANLSTTFARAPDPGSVVILDRIEDLARLTTRPAALGFAILPLALLVLPELTSSQRARLANGLAALAKSFDRVFLDAGALLEDDAVSAFLPIADEILIVTRWGTTVKTDVHELERLLERYADRPHGLVVNAVSESP